MEKSAWITAILAFLGASIGPLIYELLRKYVISSSQERAYRRFRDIMQPLDDMMTHMSHYEHILLNLWNYIDAPEQKEFESRYRDYIRLGRRMVRSAERLESALEHASMPLRIHASPVYTLLVDASSDLRRQYARNAYEFGNVLKGGSGCSKEEANLYWKECRETHERLEEAFQAFAKEFAAQFSLLTVLGS